MSDAPRNVIEALNRVMAELPAIGKDSKAADQQGSYAYRGIEAIIAHVQPLLAKHGIVFVPEVLQRETVPIVVGNGKQWTDTVLTVRYQVWCSNVDMADLGPQVEGHNVLTVGPLVGIGRDGSDKGANKAMTQALKYALLQVLMIGDRADDADGTTVEAETAETVTAEEVERREAAMRLLDEIKSLDDEGRRAELAGWLDESGIPRAPGKMKMTQIAAVEAWLHEPAPNPEPARNPSASLHDLTDEEREMALVGAMKPAALKDALRQRNMLDEADSEKVMRNRLMMALRSERVEGEAVHN